MDRWTDEQFSAYLVEQILVPRREMILNKDSDEQEACKAYLC